MNKICKRLEISYLIRSLFSFRQRYILKTSFFWATLLKSYSGNFCIMTRFQGESVLTFKAFILLLLARLLLLFCSYYKQLNTVFFSCFLFFFRLWFSFVVHSICQKYLSYFNVCLICTVWKKSIADDANSRVSTLIFRHPHFFVSRFVSG